MRYIDLRSDTVTRPSEAMRQAMATAEVGDDVFNDDPTVIRLEKMVADLFGREAALFVPSGTMGNQVCLKTISQPGDEIICEEGAHIFNYEVATAAAFSGLLFHVLRGVRGVMTAAEIRPMIRSDDIHSPRTRIITLENTHNRAGGTIFPLEEMEAIHLLAEERRLMVHLDGARIWNAHVVSGVPLAEYARLVDTLSVCLSKGLGAPIGSMVIGDQDFILEARRTRKMFGGAMRQVGIIAAAGIYAIEHNIARLTEDHDNAWYLAEAISEIDGIYVDLDSVQTNIVIMDIAQSGQQVSEVLGAFRQKGLLAVAFGPTKIRCVTHLDVTHDDCVDTIKIFKEVFES